MKKQESVQIVPALRELERELPYIVIRDEEHGIASKVNRIAAFAAVEESED